mmetsp:Transcript_59995/g.82130  ORF Transcript_59995/g.82130 Transcript_59995/m.82130 type:complete len:330 (-) Transcript_59995:302-1291(-)|eukprot:CAMPEP_0185750730 /NCGR_PEP_ID=MMETSP1174-20130828/9499_1 /TAXON_ID=35687 /ORGANISM="Dictyocha speculum, Strain CCMP1381" /LENGTH=329 /DNA_ID=CAMNT_0028427373 /DNA_START=66 /DNA_END=1055 /DNA_ORIENTATION=+
MTTVLRKVVLLFALSRVDGLVPLKALRVVPRVQAARVSIRAAATDFKPREESLWAQDAGYKKYADFPEAVAYNALTSLPPVISKNGFVESLIEKTKARPALLDGTHAGDYGFDPMNYANNEELLYFYMESEVKHCRLAMLACLGWIEAELATGDRAPSLLNGHLFDFGNFVGVVVAFGLWGYLEHLMYPAQYLKHTPNSGKLNYQHYEDGPYVAGCYNFDPLGLYSSLGDDAAGRKSMRILEIEHGRFAMVGITAFAGFEAITKIPITSAFAILFKPFWQWGLPFVGENGIIGFFEFAAILGAVGYGAFTYVSDFDSVKYQGDGEDNKL